MTNPAAGWRGWLANPLVPNWVEAEAAEPSLNAPHVKETRGTIT